MNADEMDRAGLYVERFRAEYHVSSQHRSPEQVKARLDEAWGHNIAPLLQQALAPFFSSNDPGIWLIRRLDLKLNVNAALPRERLAQQWTTQLAHELTKTFGQGNDGENILWFPNRAAFLARFLCELVSGDAWSRWQYETFAGLHMLPVSAAVRTALLEDPPTGFAALIELGLEARRVLKALNTQDARRVLDGLNPSGVGDPVRCLEGVLTAWKRRERAPLAEEIHDALELYVEVCRSDPGLGGTQLASIVVAMVRFARLVTADPANASALVSALAKHDLAMLYRALGTSSAERLAPLLNAPSELINVLATALLDHPAASITSTETVERRATAWGGLFYLLPFLDALPWGELLGEISDAESSVETLIRFLVLSKCLGGARAARIFFDPVARDIMGVLPSMMWTDIARWQRHFDTGRVRSLLQTLHAWHREQGAVGDERWLLCRVRARGGLVVVLLDVARGMWLDIQRYTPDHPERLAVWFRSTWSSAAPPTMMVNDSDLERVLGQMLPRTQLLTDDALHTRANKDDGSAELMMRRERLTDDLNFLRLARPLPLARSFDRALSVMAQSVLRAWAWRLPGFARSSLPYLFANLLDLSASVETEPERRVVRLARPPLHLILEMNGMARSVYRVRWLDERPFALFPET